MKITVVDNSTSTMIGDSDSSWYDFVDYKDVTHITLICAHDNAQVETSEVDTMRNGEHDTYESAGYWCEDCQTWLDWDLPEPDYDDLDD